jgi:hypothetical protein
LRVAQRFCEVAHLNRVIVEDWKAAQRQAAAVPSQP